MKKKYQFKIYTKDGIFIKEWNDVISDISFTAYVNGGLGELVVKLPRSIREFGENEDVKLLNELRLYCFDKDNPDGVLIYSGYLSNYQPIAEDGEEFIQCNFIGFQSELKNIIYEDVNGNTEITHNSKDPAIITRDIIDRARAQGSRINYTTDTLPPTGNTVSYTFKNQDCLEAIDKCIMMSPDDWYWYVDADKNLYFKKQKPFALHTFVLGKDIIRIIPEKRIENIVNTIYFIGGGDPPLFKKYTEENSIGKYGVKAEKIIDSRITQESTMDIFANRILSQKSEPEIRVRIEIIDNNYYDKGYDIENIKVGDTCQIRNYILTKYTSKWDIAKWNIGYWGYSIINITENLMNIVELVYKQNSIELVLSSKLPDISRRIEDINRNLEAFTTKDTPTSPS